MTIGTGYLRKTQSALPLTEPSDMEPVFANGMETRIEGETGYIVFWSDMPRVNEHGAIVMTREVVRKIVCPASMLIEARMQVKHANDLATIRVNTASAHQIGNA